MNRNEIQKEKYSLVVFLIVLFAWFFVMMRPFLMPMILAGIIVIIFAPLHGRLTKLLGGHRHWSALLMTALIFVLLILPATLVTMILIDQVNNIVAGLDLRTTFSQLFATDFYQHTVAPVLTDFETRFQVKVDIFDLLTQFGKQTAATIYNFSPKVLMSTFQFVFGFFIMIVGIYFLFVEGMALIKLFIEVSPLRTAHEKRLMRQFKNTIDASVLGYLLTALVQGVLAAGGFAVVGLPAWAVLGTVTFFMSMVPVIGATGVWLPVCVWLFLQGRTMAAFAVLLYGGLVISGIDNILKPMIIQGKTKIHPLLIFFSLFGGIALFGPIGILFGPVITALLIAALTIYREEFQSQ